MARLILETTSDEIVEQYGIDLGDSGLEVEVTVVDE